MMIAPLLVSSLLAGPGGFINLKAGEVIQGHLVSCTDTEMTGIVEPTGDERTFKRDELTPGCWYMVRNLTAGDDAKARLELARFCLANNLDFYALDQAKQAAALDESLGADANALIKQCEEAACAELMRLAEASVTAKRWDNARRLSSQVLSEFPNSSCAGRAGEILETLTTSEEATPSLEKQIVQPLNDAQVDKLRDTDPRCIEGKKYLERARSRNVAGLKERSLSAQRDLFERSISDYQEVGRILDRILAEEKDQPVIVKRVNDFKAGRFADELAEVHVNLASALASRGSYSNAQEVLSDGLVRLPGNARISNYRGHVQMLAATASSQTRWRRR